MYIISWIAIIAAVGAIIACVAHTRGRSFTLWWIYGSLLGVIALPHLLLARDLSSDRRWVPARYGLPTHDKACPFCGRPVHEEALVCRHCRQAVDPEIRRNGRKPQAGSSNAPAFAACEHPPGRASAATDVAGVAAGWSMAGYTGFSPLPAAADMTKMNARRREAAASTAASRQFEQSGDAAANPPRVAGQRPVEVATGTASEAEYPSTAGAHAAAADTAASRPAAGGRPGPGRTGSALHRRRDPGALPRPAIAAAIVACVAAALFLTPAWRFGADVVRLISPRALNSATAPSAVGTDTTADQPRAAEPVAPPDRAGDHDPAAESMPAAAPQERRIGEANTVAADATPASAGAPVASDAESASPKLTAQTPAIPAPIPQPEPVPEPSPRSAPAATADFNSATPKAKPEDGGFDAEAQANFDAVVARLQQHVATHAESGGHRSADRDTSVSAVGEVVYELQQKLKAKGFDPGGIDGRFGPQTRRALKAFQRDAGLPATGEIDRKVLIAFGLIS